MTALPSLPKGMCVKLRLVVNALKPLYSFESLPDFVIPVRTVHPGGQAGVGFIYW